MSAKARAKTLSLAHAGLEQRIGHQFRDPGLLQLALTHISAVQGGAARLHSYQRLEFLGDRVLGLAIASLLYRLMPEAMEGELASRLTDLVRMETCAEVALGWEVGELIQLSKGEARAGGRRREAILGDVCEALIAAVYLDGGFDAAQQVVERAFGPRAAATGSMLKDAKTRLQEWAQGRGLPAPTYGEISRNGPDHQPVFVIGAQVQGYPVAEGTGASKRIAEQDAAQGFFRLMEQPADSAETAR